MDRRDFLEKAGMLSTAGVLSAAGVAGATAESIKKGEKPPAIDPAEFKQIQELLGYSDEQFRDFLQSPRIQKVLSHLEDNARTSIVFEIVKAHGCLAGHKVGETFLFPTGGSMDTKNSAEKLCPFLMPPMTRLVWIIQERTWEGLDPMPLFYAGHCDDVGYDCNGIGRVVIEARIEKTKARSTE